MRGTVAEFWGKVDDSGNCWEWLGTKNVRGYGVHQSGPTMRPAHRIAYEIRKGPIPDGMLIDHMCHNTSCVNPDHLVVASQKQNAENRAGAQINNTGSGVRGVYRTREGRFQARAQHNGVIHLAGVHSTIAEAEAAVIELRLSLYTHNVRDRATRFTTA